MNQYKNNTWRTFAYFVTHSTSLAIERERFIYLKSAATNNEDPRDLLYPFLYLDLFLL